ncbi:MAG: hypothetical protein QOF78_282 [Phycisphaerales bacterium]|jgi:hypothetical protein|nr:hypothetical protein [Phycisphaerales bacterium]
MRYVAQVNPYGWNVVIDLTIGATVAAFSKDDEGKRLAEQTAERGNSGAALWNYCKREGVTAEHPAPRRPRSAASAWRKNLRRIGVIVIDKKTLRCAGCGAQWSITAGDDGQFPRRYWLCPNVCNINPRRGRSRPASNTVRSLAIQGTPPAATEASGSITAPIMIGGTAGLVSGSA